jgi:hypothetical protein
MSDDLLKTRVINRGLCCGLCQEPVNVHGCAKCGKGFVEDDTVYCKHHSQMDCEHFHWDCMPSPSAGEKIKSWKRDLR